MSIGISGSGSAIASEFLKALDSDEPVHKASIGDLGLLHDRYLICTGYLAGKAIGDQGPVEVHDCFDLNFAWIAAKCDAILNINKQARICIIGSHSGIEGSFDMAYAGAKAAMHLYIEKKPLRFPDQMLVGLAPHIICDAGMTQRREDYADCMERGLKTRQQRWLSSAEVAMMAYDVLYRWPATLSGQIIRMRCD